MWFETKGFLGLLVLGTVLSGAAVFSQEKATATDKRPVTVADAIRMTLIAGSGYAGFHPKSGFAVFSPDGRQFAFVVSRGNIDTNTNDYSLLLFHTADVSRNPVPRVLTSFSSSSNREGIFDLSWSNDNETLFFLGARGSDAAELYSIDCKSGELEKLTNHPTSLVSYAVSEEASNVVYAAERPEIGVVNDKALRHGLHITTEGLSDLIRARTWSYEPGIYLQENRSLQSKPLPTLAPFDSGVNDLFLSPDGRYVVVKTDSTELPGTWRQYEDPTIQTVFRRQLRKGFPTRILRYELIDTRAASSEVLLDSPATYSSSDVVWSPDSKSLLLCGVYLPLDGGNPTELQSRRSNKFVIEIRLPGLTFVKITNEDLMPIRWEPQTNIVRFRARPKQAQTRDVPEPIEYRRSGTGWERVMADSHVDDEAPPEILAEQDLNLAPRIVAVYSNTEQKTTLLDLNPQFAGLALGKVEELNWKDATGNPVSGGLYLPPGFKVGVRYPLVIQTHGFDPSGFWIDGPYRTAFAAQPLASKGFVVLQVNDIFYDSLVTRQEPERAMGAYENAIGLLDARGIIDSGRIGIIGFSRTCLYVKYTLTHSRIHFAAASATDGIDAGYLQYLIFSNASPYGTSEFDTIIGARPFGDGLQAWLKRSPGFMLDKVRTPVQLQALDPSSLLGEWEWFSGLRRLNRPVDLVYLPTGTHTLVKPWDRMVSQGGTVDWFSFWLKGEEDPDPAKAEQYTRWRELRKLQEQTNQTPNDQSPN